MSMKFELTGDEELIAKLRAFESRMRRPKRNLLERLIREQRGQTEEFSPVDTGLMRSSWEIDIDSRSLNEASMFSRVDYALELEFSSRKPRGVGRIPFVRPAIVMVLRKIGKFVAMFAKDVEDAFK